MNFTFTKTREFRILFGIGLALILSWLFYKVCAGGRCLVVGGTNAAADIRKDADGSCWKFDRFNTICQFPEKNSGEFVPGGNYQDPGYGSGQGSIGATYENFTADCLGMKQPMDDNNFMPYQVACRKEPLWNLPRDWRVQQQAMYPCGVPGQQRAPTCKRAHPMDSIYQSPNEGIYLNSQS